MKDKCTLTNEELITKAHEWITKLCKTGGKEWTLRVPVDFNHDPDMIFTELCNRLQPQYTISSGTEDGIVSFGKRCFYKGFDKSENDDANCYTAWREESAKLIESIINTPSPQSSTGVEEKKSQYSQLIDVCQWLTDNSKGKVVGEEFSFAETANFILDYALLKAGYAASSSEGDKANKSLSYPVSVDETARQIVDENFKGLDDIIEDKDLREWYKDLIVTCIEEYAKQFQPPVTGDAIKVLDWLLDVNANGLRGERFHKIIMCDGEFYWESDHDGDQPMEGKDIFELYQQSKGKK